MLLLHHTGNMNPVTPSSNDDGLIAPPSIKELEITFKAAEASGYLKRMDFLPKNRILQFRADSFNEIRKEYNLDKPGRMKEAVQLLHEWVQKQPHFKKKDFDPFYLETTLLGTKGSLERAKIQLDRMCTMRTLMPIFFGNYNVKTDFVHLHKVIHSAMLPKLTPDHYRVCMIKYNNVPFEASQIYDYFQNHIILAEYLKTHDYTKGFILVFDFSEANLTDYLTRINPITLREGAKIYIEGFGMRIKSINVISSSKFVNAAVSLLKQVLSQKLCERINVFKTKEDILKVLPTEILPREYGGDERCIKELSEEWVDILSSNEHMERIANMNNACTDESCRQKDVFSEQYAGMPGSFGLLNVD